MLKSRFRLFITICKQQFGLTALSPQLYNKPQNNVNVECAVDVVVVVVVAAIVLIVVVNAQRCPLTAALPCMASECVDPN